MRKINEVVKAAVKAFEVNLIAGQQERRRAETSHDPKEVRQLLSRARCRDVNVLTEILRAYVVEVIQECELIADTHRDEVYDRAYREDKAWRAANVIGKRLNALWSGFIPNAKGDDDGDQ